MPALDWVIVAVYMAGLLCVGAWAARRRTRTTSDYFVAGRSLPWWLAGTSMLATSFSADTPLQTTRMVREFGMGGNWFYWGSVVSAVGVAFFFSRLWRRTGVVTDAHFMELRYSGKTAALLRGSVGLFRGALLELITLSWIILAMTKVVRVILDLPPITHVAGLSVPTDGLVVFVLVLFALFYSVTSGLWGVVVTDLVEFVVAVLGTVVLAFIAMSHVGGAKGLHGQLAAAGHGSAADFLPRIGGSGLPMAAIVAYLFVQWWSTPYVDGSGQRAQRFLACRDERQALLSGVWNLAVQWVIRSWPVYLVALVSLVLYPMASDHESVYVRMVREMLPVGLRGIMVAGFFSAFMSTFEGILNLCSSYLSNDVYGRFLARGKDAEHHVAASRVIGIGVAAVAGTVSLWLPSILTAYRFKMELMAGLGLVSLLRWFWWRVNARTELATLAASVGATVVLNLHPAFAGDGAGPSAVRLMIIVGVCAVVTIAIALSTAPEPEAKLLAFYEKVRPPALLWGPVAANAAPGRGLVTGTTLAQCAVCLVFVFGGMFGLGKLLLGEPLLGTALTLLGGGALAYLYLRVLRTRDAPQEPRTEVPAAGTAVG